MIRGTRRPGVSLAAPRAMTPVTRQGWQGAFCYPRNARPEGTLCSRGPDKKQTPPVLTGFYKVLRSSFTFLVSFGEGERGMADEKGVTSAHLRG